MRKVLFVHDGPFRIDENSNYYGVQAGDNQRKRYLLLGDKVTFLMRLKQITQAERYKYSLIKKESFTFKEVPDFLSISRYLYKKVAIKIIKQEVDLHDVIVVRLPSATGYIAFQYAKQISKPVIVEIVACVHDSLWNYDWRGKVLAHYKLKQYQNLMKDATHTIYVTNEFLQSRYPSPGKSIGCSDVELQEIDQEVLSIRIQRIKNLEKPLKSATVAAIDVAYKAQADVIKAIAKLKKNGVFFKYDIIGQGNPRILQKLIDDLDLNDLVKIIGPLPHYQIFKALKNIDIYIQPSLTEGLPRAVLEAMSMACPVIGSDAGGIPELIDEKCLYPKGNVNALASLLSSIDEAFLLRHASLNFEKAKEYQKESLESKRINFYNTFLEDYNLA